ncbi:unnamed protein product [Brachionus calyciflorus]|uniref:Vacuolar protein sorting-associated protein 72 homolog n=1 Tax=Brachionus calyciflorus TaxID=104777 RepID=A0A813WRQ4_9BILA|nr:unnamed protein product [Brachionus calyciflorus]
MSLVTERERRKNAGSKMAKLLNEEEDDEFYKTAYGGFNEADDDQEFEAKESDEEEDYVDSDFDLDENSEPENEMDVDEDEEKKRKKSRNGVVTKAYKEPRKKTEIIEKKKPKDRNVDENLITQRDSKSVRNSTARKREELQQKQEEREAQKKLKIKKTSIDQGEYRRMTQEELLEEAKITEQINLASLDAYQKMELEKKKKTQSKQVIKGPFIRYHSVTMPLAENNSNEKQCRNFITFSDEKTLNEIFPKQKLEPSNVNNKLCEVTRLPAKYFDPVTKKPFANLFAFKNLREKYLNDDKN